MMDCTNVRTLVDAWENGQNIGAADLSAFHAHLSECPACARRFNALLPLLMRDEGTMHVTDTDTIFTDNVMARIAARESGSDQKRTHPSAPPTFRLVRIGVAAAALLLVAVGLGIGLGFHETDTVKVRFVLDAPEARTVELAANFTNWETSGYALTRVSQDGPWELKVTLRKGSLYSYNFVIDGEVWIPDPSIPEKVDDGFGGASSLLRL